MSKRNPKRNVAVDNTVSFDDYVQRRRSVQLIPKSLKQEEYIAHLLNPECQIVFATGAAGTGKTMLAMAAAIHAFKSGEVSKIVMTRPAVGVDNEKHGFLPGDINSKMEPWTRPLFDVLHEYYNPKEVARMLDDQAIEISPLAFMRGRTFKNSWIVADEMQSSSENQMKMLLTRLGEGSKIVVTGDLRQTDREFANNSGLVDFLARLNVSSSKHIAKVDFTARDTQRSKIVAEVLKIYGED